MPAYSSIEPPAPCTIGPALPISNLAQAIIHIVLLLAVRLSLQGCLLLQHRHSPHGLSRVHGSTCRITCSTLCRNPAVITGPRLSKVRAAIIARTGKGQQPDRQIAGFRRMMRPHAAPCLALSVGSCSEPVTVRPLIAAHALWPVPPAGGVPLLRVRPSDWPRSNVHARSRGRHQNWWQSRR